MLSRTRTRHEPSVFFPWEKRRGVLGAFARGRARVVVGGGLSLLAVMGVYDTAERASAVRSTRATLTSVGRAVQAYRADNAGACPRSLGDVVTQGYLRGAPVDAWGHAVRVECPGRQDPRGFDVSSDGPDGVPGGLDRVQ
jgi:general secretion pathway protein G